MNTYAPFEAVSTVDAYALCHIPVLPVGRCGNTHQPLRFMVTFNDFISGIILLFEGTIRVGDILEIENQVVKIQKIGLRTSEAIDRDDIITIVTVIVVLALPSKNNSPWTSIISAWTRMSTFKEDGISPQVRTMFPSRTNNNFWAFFKCFYIKY